MLFVGDDWAEDHHDVEIQDEAGRRLAAARLPEGVAGIARLHELVGEWLGEDAAAEQVLVGIETDRGLWVTALVAAGYRVYAINPRRVARHREVLSDSAGKTDALDARVLADMVRTRRHQLRPVAGDSPAADAIKIVARAHKTLIWERARHVLRLRAALREYFPAALTAYQPLGLTGADTLELLAAAPEPAAAARLRLSRIQAVLRRAGRRDVAGKAAAIQAALRTRQLTQPAPTTAAYAAVVASQAALIAAINSQIRQLEDQVHHHFGQHPDAEIYLSQPGLGVILSARVLAEFGDDPNRYATAKARKNYAGTSPITRQSGRTKTVHARWIHNDRLLDAATQWAFTALTASPGARHYYNQLRHRGIGHHAALRQLANRLIGILHGCLKTHTPYNETTAWAHHQHAAA